MVPFKYLNTLSNAIQWEWSRLCIYFPNLQISYVGLENFVKCKNEPIIEIVDVVLFDESILKEVLSWRLKTWFYIEWVLCLFYLYDFLLYD